MYVCMHACVFPKLFVVVVVVVVTYLPLLSKQADFVMVLVPVVCVNNRENCDTIHLQ